MSWLQADTKIFGMQLSTGFEKVVLWRQTCCRQQQHDGSMGVAAGNSDCGISAATTAAVCCAQVLRLTVEATGMARRLCAPREVIVERLFKR